MACLGAEGRGSRVGEAIAATQRARSTIPVLLKIATRSWESTAYAAAGGGKPTGKARPEGGDCQPTATAFRAYARLRHDDNIRQQHGNGIGAVINLGCCAHAEKSHCVLHHNEKPKLPCHRGTRAGYPRTRHSQPTSSAPTAAARMLQTMRGSTRAPPAGHAGGRGGADDDGVIRNLAAEIARAKYK